MAAPAAGRTCRMPVPDGPCRSLSCPGCVMLRAGKLFRRVGPFIAVDCIDRQKDTMEFHADLHVHSKYSRATSRDLDLEHLAWWAARKGIAVVGTGDCVHPAWLAEIKDKLTPAGGGLFALKPEIEAGIFKTLPPACRTPVRFM